MNNGDGSFSESGLEAGVADVVQNPKGGIGRGTAVADFNRDGKEDIFITNINGETSRLLKNVTPDNGNNWLSIRLGGTISNKRGIGAKVRVTSGQGTSSKTQLKEVHAGSGHGSSNDLSRLHFGLGDAAFATLVTVEWPSGCTQILSRVDPGVVDITENCSP